MANAPVPGKSQKQGVPASAPTPTNPVTGLGEAPKGAAGHPGQPGLAAQPPSAGSTGPILGSPSVDYNSQQGNRIPAEVQTAQHKVIVGQQDQQNPDKAGA